MDLFKELLSYLDLKSEARLPGYWTAEQRKVYKRLKDEADQSSRRLGMDRRQFLKTSMGMASFFLAMNEVFGHFFEVSPSEAAGETGTTNLSRQFIFDVQVHFVHDNYPNPRNLLMLRKTAQGWNPELKGEKPTAKSIMFDNFFRETFQNSQTTMAVLSNAPADKKEGWFLSNEQAMKARKMVNDRLGSNRLLAHALFTPGQPGWLDEMDRVIALRPDAWKGYTLGDPRGQSNYPWRLDDEKLVYPAYEKMERAGIRNVCIHKGLLPEGYERRFSKVQIECAGPGDIGKAAKDWPNLNFIIYHAAIEKGRSTAEDVAEFRRTGRIRWITDLSEIPEKYGVRNVYGELGGVFAATAIAYPELCTAVLGTLIRGLGPDHVCWGTDSIWWGSPQWQIEAMRRMEIPEEMQKKYGFKPLGAADGPVKRKIFGETSAGLYRVKPTT